MTGQQGGQQSHELIDTGEWSPQALEAAESPSLIDASP